MDITLEQQLHGPGSSVPSRFAGSDSWSIGVLSGSGEVGAGRASDDIAGEVVMFGSGKGLPV